MSTYYMIGNAHLDPVWMWRWQEGYAEVRATVRSALDRMKEYPDFRFVCSSANIHDWLDECCPDMIEEIRQRIREGRWIVVGGQWVQPDHNIPSGEGLVRQFLYAQRWFFDHFGVTAKTGYCVDTFGHCATLPQILKKSGLESFVFMRPSPPEKAMPNLFLWQSPDGTKIPTFRLADPYCANFTDADQLQAHLKKSITQVSYKDKTLCFYGVGNHGGGPTKQNIELIQNNTTDDLRFADPTEFFSLVDNDDLPVHNDDLQHHAAGCYAAYSPIKQAIRQCETRLIAAEKYDALAHLLIGSSCHTNEFSRAWKNTCFLHFHDIAGGCAIPDAYRDSLEFAGEALSIAAKQENRALQSLASRIPTGDGTAGIPLILFNSHSYPVRTAIQVNANFIRITDADGNPVPCQPVHSQSQCCMGRPDTLFPAEIPAWGWRVYYGQKTEAEPMDLACNPILENEYLRARFDSTGELISIFDIQSGKEMLGHAMSVPVLDESKHDTWSHGRNRFDHVIGSFANQEFSLIENGPVRRTFRTVSRFRNSRLIRDFSLGITDRALKITVMLDWQEPQCLCKIAVPFAETAVHTRYAIPYGQILRPLNGEEEPAQKWAALESATHGLAILNDCKYSYSASHNTLYVTAVRSPYFGDHGNKKTPLCEVMDLGVHRFTLALLPYKAGQTGLVNRQAELLNTPPALIMDSFHDGELPQEYQGISASTDHVEITAIKGAENGIGMVLRAVETAGEATSAVITLGDSRISCAFAPFEIKTFRIHKQITEIALTELGEAL